MSRVVALCGGVGGAKLALGLAHELPGEDLSIIVNTGDDFRHLGLHVSPDVDTVLYTLGGIANRAQGWGIEGESWAFMEQLGLLGGEQWFNLGDRDLALHVLRTQALASGQTLTEFTARIAHRLGIAAAVLPMSDDPVPTMLDTAEGVLEFQRYFVERRAEPVVSGIRYVGASSAEPSASVLAALADEKLEAVIVCPSNPWLSVAPILAIPGLQAALRATSVPVVAVTPIVAGAAIKGPTAKLMRELGLPVDAVAVARFYGDLIDGFVLDEADAGLAGAFDGLGLPTISTPTVMTDLASRCTLARDVLSFARRLRS